MSSSSSSSHHRSASDEESADAPAASNAAAVHDVEAADAIAYIDDEECRDGDGDNSVSVSASSNNRQSQQTQQTHDSYEDDLMKGIAKVYHARAPGRNPISAVVARIERTKVEDGQSRAGLAGSSLDGQEAFGDRSTSTHASLPSPATHQNKKASARSLVYAEHDPHGPSPSRRTKRIIEGGSHRSHGSTFSNPLDDAAADSISAQTDATASNDDEPPPVGAFAYIPGRDGVAATTIPAASLPLSASEHDTITDDTKRSNNFTNSAEAQSDQPPGKYRRRRRPRDNQEDHRAQIPQDDSDMKTITTAEIVDVNDDVEHVERKLRAEFEQEKERIQREARSVVIAEATVGIVVADDDCSPDCNPVNGPDTGSAHTRGSQSGVILPTNDDHEDHHHHAASSFCSNKKYIIIFAISILLLIGVLVFTLPRNNNNNNNDPSFQVKFKYGIVVKDAMINYTPIGQYVDDLILSMDTVASSVMVDSRPDLQKLRSRHRRHLDGYVMAVELPTKIDSIQRIDCTIELFGDSFTPGADRCEEVVATVQLIPPKNNADDESNQTFADHYFYELEWAILEGHLQTKLDEMNSPATIHGLLN